jgi:hypothetical protein
VVRHKERKRYIRLVTWNVRRLTGAARELARYKLDLVAVQEVRWDEGGTVRAGDYNFLYGKGNKIFNLEQDFLYTTELYQHLREYSLLVIGCYI